MFTGIVEEVGVLESAVPGPHGTRLVFSAGRVLDGTGIGDSISVNGCCLTVVDMTPGRWSADAVAETLSRTNLGSLAPGDPVNLERAVAVGSRLGGHLVQGHVDGVGLLERPAPDLEISHAAELSRYLVPKGSITVNGVSLTVVTVRPGGFSIAVIPHTMAVTTLGRLRTGDRVNLEVDVIAKYAEQLLRSGLDSPYSELAITRER
jgi:riboflavin synthase